MRPQLDNGWQQRLKRALETHNLSAVARKCGLPQSNIWNWISRGDVPNAVYAARLCQHLGVSVESIFGDPQEAAR